MALEIRVPETAWSLQEVLLGGIALLLELNWNTRNESWHISLFDLDEEPILQGIKITDRVSPTKRYTDLRLPEGNIYCAKVNKRATGITRTNLGTDYKLIYASKEEEADVGL